MDGSLKQLILGGARSGKSGLAEHLAERNSGEVVYVATAVVGDAEMQQRVTAHRQRRPSEWRTVEEPLHIGRVVNQEAGPGVCLLVDCLTLWLSNLLLHPDKETLSREREALLNSVENAAGPIIMVSNEVGLGIVPTGEISRRFQDQAGWLHQALAARCDRVIFTVAGLPQVLKGELL